MLDVYSQKTVPARLKSESLNTLWKHDIEIFKLFSKIYLRINEGNGGGVAFKVYRITE